MRHLLRHSPNRNRICTAWQPTRRHWAAAYRNRKDTQEQSTTTTACRGTGALRMPIYKVAQFTSGGTSLIQCQLRAQCSTLVIFLIPHPLVWTTAVPLRFRVTTTTDRVTPIPHTQTSALTTRLREGCTMHPNSRICKDPISVLPISVLFITSLVKLIYKTTLREKHNVLSCIIMIDITITATIVIIF